jgi:hypothetical protein
VVREFPPSCTSHFCGAYFNKIDKNFSSYFVTDTNAPTTNARKKAPTTNLGAKAPTTNGAKVLTINLGAKASTTNGAKVLTINLGAKAPTTNLILSVLESHYQQKTN